MENVVHIGCPVASSRDSEIVSESPGRIEGSFLLLPGGSNRASRKRAVQGTENEFRSLGVEVQVAPSPLREPGRRRIGVKNELSDPWTLNCAATSWTTPCPGHTFSVPSLSIVPEGCATIHVHGDGATGTEAPTGTRLVWIHFANGVER
jgi:hypothetical protein